VSQVNFVDVNDDHLSLDIAIGRGKDNSLSIDFDGVGAVDGKNISRLQLREEL